MDKSKINLWESYFILMCAVEAFEFFDIIKSASFELTEYTSLILELIALLALYGYSYKAAIFSPVVWRIYAILYVMYLITYLVYGEGYQELILSASQKHYSGDTMFTLSIIYSLKLIAMLPLYASIFLYSKPSNSFWLQSPNKLVKQTG